MINLGTSFLVMLSAVEIEALYDALDARNDRFEQWKKDAGPDEIDPVKLEADLDVTSRLEKDFQPLIRAIRGKK